MLLRMPPSVLVGLVEKSVETCGARGRQSLCKLGIPSGGRKWRTKLRKASNDNPTSGNARMAPTIDKPKQIPELPSWKLRRVDKGNSLSHVAR